MVPLVVVLGSANLDCTFTLPKLPAPGETLLASETERRVGGKGLNQATASRRAGCSTAFIGSVGLDQAGQELARWLETEGVDTSGLRYVAGTSGLATIFVDPDGENMIVVSPGANSELSISGSDTALIAGAAVLVLQCEVPEDVLVTAASVARNHATRVLLNAAPARPLSQGLLDRVDILVVNEHEASSLLGDVSGRGGPEAQGRTDPARRLSELVPDAVVTHGKDGVSWAGISGSGQLGAPSVTVVDTTGAGDTFVGYLAAGLAARAGWAGCLRQATAASALTVQRPGGAASIPVLEGLTAPDGVVGQAP